MAFDISLRDNGASSFDIALSDAAAESASISPSASPSTGYTGYTRGNYASLPINDSDLSTSYSAGDVTDVATDNSVRVSQSAVGEYMLHQFKDFVGSATHCVLTWNGQSSLAPSTSGVYLQIYNQNTTTWETLDSNTSAGASIDFTLSAPVSSLTNYKDGSNVISCRVYQLAT